MNKKSIEEFLKEHGPKKGFCEEMHHMSKVVSYLHRLYKRRGLVSKETAENLKHVLLDKISDYVNAYLVNVRNTPSEAHMRVMPIYIDLGMWDKMRKYVDKTVARIKTGVAEGYVRTSDRLYMDILEDSAEYYNKCGDKSKEKECYYLIGDVHSIYAQREDYYSDSLYHYRKSKEFYTQAGLKNRKLEDRLAGQILTKYNIDISEARNYFKDLSLETYAKKSDDQLMADMVYHLIKKAEGVDDPEVVFEYISKIKNPKAMRELMNKKLTVQEVLAYIAKIETLSDSVDYEREQRCSDARDHVLSMMGRMF